MAWDGLFMLLTLSLVMGVASFLAGLLPLSFGLSQNHSRAISAIGTGLLVGTCLIIIIPEGIETLYDSSTPSEPTRTSSSYTSSSTSTSKYETRAPEETNTHQTQPHAFVGISLVAGFILMYLIDQIPKHAAAGTGSIQKPLHISLANLSQGPHRASSPSRVEEGELLDDPAPEPQPLAPGSATTIGLVIHAAADGIALAASSFITESSVGFVVFIALMFHKAPAAFGLTSVLLKQGLTKRQARAHLLVFSVAAPIGALATWALVNVVAGGHIEGGESTKFWTGLLLLFSGGTFLYVAMHTMQEHGGEHHEPSTNGYSNGDAYSNSRIQHEDHNHPTMRDTLLSVLGMVLPLLAQAGHAH